jgi:hypothetical protein
LDQTKAWSVADVRADMVRNSEHCVEFPSAIYHSSNFETLHSLKFLSCHSIIPESFDWESVIRLRFILGSVHGREIRQMEDDAEFFYSSQSFGTTGLRSSTITELRFPGQH